MWSTCCPFGANHRVIVFTYQSMRPYKFYFAACPIIRSTREMQGAAEMTIDDGL
jgi:hypothetical protein